MTALFLTAVAFAQLIPSGAGYHRVRVDINTNQYIHESRNEFLSFSLSCEHFRIADITDPAVVAAVSGLAPAVLRIGGTSCNYMTFNKRRVSYLSEDYSRKPFTFNSTDWDRVVQLAHVGNLSLLFDANVMLRDEYNQWNPSNMKTFLDYNQMMGYTNLLFELGNEPTDYPALFNKTITPSQLAADFGSLHKLLGSYPLYRNSLIVGPDIVNPHLDNESVPDPTAYLERFLEAGHELIDAITWHQYYHNGKTATLADFIDPGLMDDFPKEVNLIKQTIYKVLGRSFPLWMGETSSTYGGGSPNISNSYVAGFLWIDKLGVSARSGYDVVIRQALFGGAYALIDKNLQPYPDYWLSLLYKQLVGTRSLPLTVNSTMTSLRAYAACTNVRYGAEAGDVTVYAMNLDKSSAVTISTNISSSSILAYNMEPTDGTLTSPYVNINGLKAKLTNNKLPDILPRRTRTITLKPLTFGLFVLAGANATACL